MPKQAHEIEGAVAPVGPYSVAAEAHGLVFVAGQVAIDPATDTPVEGDITTQARRVMENLRVVLEGLDLGFEDVVKTNVYLADIRDYPAFNDVYAEFFEGDYPARAAVQAAGLPGGYLVEVEAIAAR